MLCVPAMAPCAELQFSGTVNPALLGTVRVRLQNKLGPFGLVTGLVTPGFEDVARVVAVVFPVWRPGRVEMLPDEVIRPGRGLESEALDQ